MENEALRLLSRFQFMSITPELKSPTCLFKTSFASFKKQTTYRIIVARSVICFCEPFLTMIDHLYRYRQHYSDHYKILVQ